MSTKAPNPVDKYVGSRVRMRRIMLGMSQEKLGEALGLDGVVVVVVSLDDLLLMGRVIAVGHVGGSCAGG